MPRVLLQILISKVQKGTFMNEHGRLIVDVNYFRWCQGNEFILEEYATVLIGCFISVFYSVLSEGKFAVPQKERQNGIKINYNLRYLLGFLKLYPCVYKCYL